MAKLKASSSSSSSVFLLLIIVVLAVEVNAEAGPDDAEAPPPAPNEGAKQICGPIQYMLICYKFLANVSGIPDAPALPALAASGLEAQTRQEYYSLERQWRAMPDKASPEAGCVKACMRSVLGVGEKAQELAAAGDVPAFRAFLNGTDADEGGNLVCHNKCLPKDSSQVIDRTDLQLSVHVAYQLVDTAFNQTSTPK